MIWAGVYSDGAVSFPLNQVEPVFPIEVVTEVRPVFGSERIFVCESSIVVEPPWATGTLYFDEFNWAEWTISITVVPRILPRTQHHKALVGQHWNCKVEVLWQGMFCQYPPGDAAQTISWSLTSIDDHQLLHEDFVGLHLLFDVFGNYNDIRSQLSPGSGFSTSHQLAGRQPQVQSGQSKDDRKGCDNFILKLMDEISNPNKPVVAISDGRVANGGAVLIILVGLGLSRIIGYAKWRH